ncbi:MAG: hypothetical protein K1W14_08475 [Muribaculaceae bacterium]
MTELELKQMMELDMKAFAQTGAVQCCLGFVINKGDTVNSALVSVKEYNINVALVEFGNEIILTRRLGKSIGNPAFGRGDVDFSFARSKRLSLLYYGTVC